MERSMTPNFAHPAEWQQMTGLARTACARIFRDGGNPADALRAFGLPDADAPRDWSVAVDRIAASFATRTQRVAA
jgi:hypothetical protein